VRFAVAAVVACGLCRAAWADPKRDAEAVYDEGQKLYDAKSYEAAAEKFRAAHALDPDPVYLFNMAQALRFAKKCDAAVAYYQRFLDEVPAAPNRADVEGYLAEVRRCATPREAVEAPLPPPPARAPSPSSGGGVRLAGIAVGVVGIAAIGVGAYYTSQVLDANAFLASCANGCAWSKRHDEALVQGERGETRQLLAYSVGGVAVVAGAILLMRNPKREAPRIGVAPLAGGGAMATTGFRF
jgi:tetratricopeptide (TPR) repeat protein